VVPGSGWRHLLEQGVDGQEVAKGLHNKMRSAGVDTRRYNLPVVEVDAYILVQPDIGDVVDRY